jgi:hypothetical protein
MGFSMLGNTFICLAAKHFSHMLPGICAFFAQRAFVVTDVEILAMPAIFPLCLVVKCSPLIFLLFASVHSVMVCFLLLTMFLLLLMLTGFLLLVNNKIVVKIHKITKFLLLLIVYHISRFMIQAQPVRRDPGRDPAAGPAWAGMGRGVM